MRIIKFLFLLVCLCACAPSNINKGVAPVRNYPVFLRGEENFAALRFNLKAAGREYNALLTLNKKSDAEYKVKMLADFATLVIDADFVNGQLYYKYILGNIFDQRSADTFTDLIKVLLVPPTDFVKATNPGKDGYQIIYRSGAAKNKYYFKGGLSFPYAMDQSGSGFSKKFTFQNYDIYGSTSLPSVITCSTAHGFVDIKLTLISVK